MHSRGRLLWLEQSLYSLCLLGVGAALQYKSPWFGHQWLEVWFLNKVLLRTESLLKLPSTWSERPFTATGITDAWSLIWLSFLFLRPVEKEWQHSKLPELSHPTGGFRDTPSQHTDQSLLKSLDTRKEHQWLLSREEGLSESRLTHMRFSPP